MGAQLEREACKSALVDDHAYELEFEDTSGDSLDLDRWLPYRLPRLPIDARDFHVYAAEWTRQQVAFFVDGEPAKTVRQSPAYPMQLMLGIYEFPPEDDAAELVPAAYPKAFVIDYVRGYRAADREELDLRCTA
jgi:hypothetical protein